MRNCTHWAGGRCNKGLYGGTPSPGVCMSVCLEWEPKVDGLADPIDPIQDTQAQPCCDAATVVGNATKALGRVVTAALRGNSVRVNIAEKSRRLAICARCPSLDAGSCLRCGCRVEIKARLTTETCPDLRWDHDSATTLIQPEPMPELKNLTDWFDHVYLINCQHRPDRLERTLSHLTESGMATVADVEVVPGVIGDWTTHPAGWGGGRGAWGCLKSHIKVMEAAMHCRDDRGQLSWDSILILEDDVFFVEDALTRLNSFMGALPQDWGQLYLGGQHRRPMEATAFPGVVMGRSVNRTHAYAISARYVQALYCHVSYMPDYVGNNKHIDHQLELAHQRADWPVYCPEQWIAGQAEGSSNVNGKINGRQLWQ